MTRPCFLAAVIALGTPLMTAADAPRKHRGRPYPTQPASRVVAFAEPTAEVRAQASPIREPDRLARELFARVNRPTTDRSLGVGNERKMRGLVALHITIKITRRAA